MPRRREIPPWFDFGIRAMQRTTWQAFREPVAGVRLYFRCGCRRRAGLFPWIEPEWDVLDGVTAKPMYGYRRVCVTHRRVCVTHRAQKADAAP